MKEPGATLIAPARPPLKGAMMRKSTEERFWERVEKTDTCWLWTGGLDKDGYGWTYPNGKTRRAHAVAYELVVGPVPDGLQLDHLCRVRHCVNPDHLEPVTRRENILRGVGPTAINARRNTCPKGHPIDGFKSTGARECKTCRRASYKKFRDANKEKRAAYQREYWKTYEVKK
jgi:hypothetical protein